MQKVEELVYLQYISNQLLTNCIQLILNYKAVRELDEVRIWSGRLKLLISVTDQLLMSHNLRKQDFLS